MWIVGLVFVLIAAGGLIMIYQRPRRVPWWEDVGLVKGWTFLAGGIVILVMSLIAWVCWN
jgi:hypothetical protein